MRTTWVLLAIGALAVRVAAGDPPKPLHLVETVEIKAPVDKVWAAVKDFDALPKWHPGFAGDELVSGSNGRVGSVRKLTIKDGPVIVEQLIAYSDASHSYRYRIIDSPLPIADYSSIVMVRAGKDGMTEVAWSGTWKRKNPADNPPEAESDAGTIKLIKGVYRGGLDNLKKMLEGG
jgi:mxaD protein